MDEDLDEIETSSDSLNSPRSVLGQLLEHYTADVRPSDFPRWSQNQVWVNCIHPCPITHHKQCRKCVKFCFSAALRGQPIRRMPWFLDKHRCATVKFKEQVYYKIKQDLFKTLRSHEIKLRLISRLMVLHDLVKRYRGIKHENDSIDMILGDYNFKSLEAWCDWKDGFDGLVFEKYMASRSERHFCTGCGERSILFTSKKGEDYEKCATGACDYFHKVGSDFATVNKRY